ncbi:Protein of unknown function [Leuconostoc citreum]|nr:Protein of unknown function [Leuconostoc citreum]CDX66806.1 Protein of unknown function [Leuconostoc citreum]
MKVDVVPSDNAI